jgi:hypothetical protein
MSERDSIISPTSVFKTAPLQKIDMLLPHFFLNLVEAKAQFWARILFSFYLFNNFGNEEGEDE